MPQSVLPSKPIPSSDPESEIELETRPIDERPRKEVEDEGWQKLRQLHAQRKAQGGGK